MSLARELYRAYLRDPHLGDFKLFYFAIKQSLISFYGGGRAPSSPWVRVLSRLSYVDGGKPIEVKVTYDFKEDTGLLHVSVNLDRGYDVMVNGEPIDLDAYHRDGKSHITDFLIEIERVDDHSMRVTISSLDLLKLYLLERRHGIVSSIINELERGKQKTTFDDYERGDFDSALSFLKWIRDKLFPLLDETIDIRTIKNLNMLSKLEAKDVYSIMSLLEFITRLH